MHVIKDINNYINSNIEELVEIASTLVRFKTVTPELDDNPKTDSYFEFDRKEFVYCQDYISDIISSFGVTPEKWIIDPSTIKYIDGCGLITDRNYSDMPVLAAKIKGSGEGRSLLLNGHYDVVQPGKKTEWTYDPFSGEIVDERIYGRGISDMKGGIAAMLFALQAIKECDVKLAGDIIIQTVPDEEATSMGTLSCCNEGYKADGALIPEPTNMNVMIAVRGVWSGTITVPGRAGHAEQTQPHWKEGGAVNAINKAVFIIQHLNKLNDEWKHDPDRQHKYLDPEIIIPTIINGGNYITNYPEEVKIGLESMSHPGNMKKHEELTAYLENICALDSWLAENPATLKRSTWLYGAEVSEDEPIAKLGLEIMRKYNSEAKFVGYGSLTDSIHLINYSGIPSISIGPYDIGAHQNNENVKISTLTDISKAIAEFIISWCGIK